jgi:amino acid adenylation domain-containing protein
MENSDLTVRLASLSPAKRALLELKLNESSPGQAARVTIPRRAERDVAPLSFAQQRLWFLSQLDPESSAYNEKSALRLDGSLNLAALRAALKAIFDRHEVLRTTYGLTEGGQPVQRIGQSVDFDLPVIVVNETAADRRDEEVQRIAAALSERPFDLSQEMPLRLALIRLTPNSHVLIAVRHHIASDGWSSGVFWRELTSFYGSFCNGRTSSLGELPIQYADFALWQRQWLQGEVLQKQVGYWTKQLRDLQVLELPTERPRSAATGHRGAKRFFDLPTPLLGELRQLGHREGATLFMTLLAAFQILLHRYTGQDDVVVGSPIAGRTRPETEGLIGFFVNMLVLRTRLSGNPTFRELLARVRETALAAYEHQEIPFEKLVEELNPGRDQGETPLFQVAFAVQNVPRTKLAMPGLRVTPLEIEASSAKFDLFIAFIEEENRSTLRFEYRAELFAAPTIARMFDHFQRLLEAIVADPERCIGDLPMLTAAERHQLLVEWNDTRRDYPSDQYIHQLFEAQVTCAPDAAAIVFEGQQLTYRELNERANQLARHLKKFGVGADVLVAISLERSVELVIGLLAILKAGGAYVPLDPSYPKERLAFMLLDCGAPVLITQRCFAGVFTDTKVKILTLDDDRKKIAQHSKENLAPANGSDNLAYVIYTSGSTGEPKGVAVPHRAVNRLVMNTDYVALSATDVMAQASNVSFDAATFEIWGTLLNGAKLVLIAKDTLLSPQALSAAIDRHGITTLFLTTALFNQMVKQIPTALAKLKHLLFGGEAVEPQRVRDLTHQGPPKHLLHVYGPTETTTFASFYPVKTVDADAATVAIGRPIANTEIYILDAQLNPVPIGVTGELYIGGPGVARGYLNRPELTAAKFIANPFHGDPEARLYRTGDLARYLPDGNIEFIGRIDHQVKIHGYRIELGEIEAALSQHPAVREAVVMAQEYGPSEKRLIAYVVTAGVSRATDDELRRALQQRLPEYMVPAAFVFIDALPLTVNGKVDRKSLPKPESIGRQNGGGYIAPRTAAEAKLAEIWAATLKLDRISIEDSFFELGGHSLIAVRLVAEMERQLGCGVSVAQLFKFPTIAQLAGELGPRVADQRAPILAVQPMGSMPPFFCVHGYAAYGEIARHFRPRWPFYGLGQHFSGRRVRHTRVEDQAKAHLREIYAIQPSGPYYLAGHSIGGMIAFEIARRLRHDGHEVAFLGLIDTVFPRRSSAPRQQFRAGIWSCWGALTRLNAASRFDLLIDNLKALAGWQLKAMQCYGYHLIDKPLPPELLTFYVDEVVFRRKYAREQRRYRPQPYIGRVDYFRAAQSLTDVNDWRALIDGKLVLHEIPGTHLTMIEEAGAAELAGSLKSCVEQAAADRQRVSSRAA